MGRKNAKEIIEKIRDFKEKWELKK